MMEPGDTLEELRGAKRGDKALLMEVNWPRCASIRLVDVSTWP